MSMEYCHDCDQHIDTDYDAEHFDMHREEQELIAESELLKDEYTK